MSNNKQSSVEELFQKLWDTPKDKFTWYAILEEHKAMHKEEIIKSFDEDQEYEYQYHINYTSKVDSETYYNETFKK